MSEEERQSSIEDEYIAQQSIGFDKSENLLEGEKQSEQEKISLLLVDISETLKILQEQMTTFNKIVNVLPETIQELITTTTNLRALTDQLPMIVHKQCLDEYKKIVNNAVKNYQQFRRSTDSWQKSLGQNHEKKFNWIMISAIITPVLLLLNILFKY